MDSLRITFLCFSPCCFPTKKFLDQVKADAFFLAKMGIMDYSLLVGVHGRIPKLVPGFSIGREEGKMNAFHEVVEDAVEQIGNRFDLVLVAARRARQLATEGKTPQVDMGNDKPTVTALREIEQGLVTSASIEAEEIRDQQHQDEVEFASVANILSE